MTMWYSRVRLSGFAFFSGSFYPLERGLVRSLAAMFASDVV